MQRPRCSMKLPKMRRSTVPIRRARSIPMRAMTLPSSGMCRRLQNVPGDGRGCRRRDDILRRVVGSASSCEGGHRGEETVMTADAGAQPTIGMTRGTGMTRGMTRHGVRPGAAGLGGAALGSSRARNAAAQGKPTITYWNGLTGADGKIMDELITQFTKETGIGVEQQRIQWADLYAKLQVSVPAGEGPDLALIHTVEVPHFASDGILDLISDSTLATKGFRAEDYLPATWQGGVYLGKRYAVARDVPQHLLYLNVKVMKDAGLAGADGKPRVPGTRDQLVTMAKQVAKGDTFGFAIGTANPGKYTWGFHNLLWQNGANV